MKSRFRTSRLLLLSRQFNGSGCGVLRHPFAYVQDVSFWNPLRRLSAFVSEGCISPLLGKYIFRFVGKCAFIPTCGHKGDVILTAPASQKDERNVHRMPACTVLLFWQSGIHGQALCVHANLLAQKGVAFHHPARTKRSPRYQACESGQGTR